jgi:HNH endonuclease
MTATDHKHPAIEAQPVSVPAVGFPGYEVNEFGDVYSVASNWRGYGKRKMRVTLNKYGYCRVRILVEGERRPISVHRIVAVTFKGPKPSPYHQVRHLDGDKTNNHKDNIEWGTAKDNADDRARHGRTSRGVSHSIALRNSTQAEAIRKYFQSRAAGKLARAALAKVEA